MKNIHCCKCTKKEKETETNKNERKEEKQKENGNKKRQIKKPVGWFRKLHKTGAGQRNWAGPFTRTTAGRVRVIPITDAMGVE